MTLAAAALGTALLAGPTVEAAAAIPGTFPTIAVEIAFGSNPFATPVWEEVSHYTMDGSVQRGRSSELDKIRAGVATVTLTNEDRRFDPTYTSSPYYPNVLPMRRMRIRGTYGGVTYDVFNGFIDRWEQDYQHPQVATATVTATDAFKVLAAKTLPPGAYAAEVSADGPVNWWRLDEQGGTVAHDAIGDVDLTARNSPTLGGPTLVARDSGGSADFDDGTTFDEGFIKDGIPLPLSGGPLTIEAVVRLDATGAGLIASNFTHFGGTGAALDVDLGFAVVLTPGAPQSTGFGGPGLTVGQVHHIAGVWNDDGTLKVYVDGVDRTVGTPSLTIADFPQQTGFALIGAFDEDGMLGEVDEVAFYDRALTVAEIQAHADLVTLPWDGDTSGVRVGRILDVISWPSADRDIDVGESTFSSADLSGTALSYLQKAEESEGGLLFITKGGNVRFRSRHEGMNLPVMATFGDDAAGTELEYVDISFDYSEGLIYNEIRVSRSEGISQSAEDTTSQETYGVRTYTADGLLIDDDVEARDRAYFLLGRYKDPVFRTTRMVVQPAGGDEANLYPQVLGRELGDKVRVRRRPQNVGAAIDQAVMIEGIRHQFADLFWRTDFMLSPVSPTGEDTEYLQLDDTDGPGLGFVALAY